MGAAWESVGVNPVTHVLTHRSLGTFPIAPAPAPCTARRGMSSPQATLARLTGWDNSNHPAGMAIANHGDVELFFETFGAATDPMLLLINGLGSQCINYDERWCEKFAAQGYRVIRFDNRDTGLSSKLDGRTYSLRDMAGDAVAVLDAVNATRAHVLGVSMGGMIVATARDRSWQSAAHAHVRDVDDGRSRVREELAGSPRGVDGSARPHSRRVRREPGRRATGLRLEAGVVRRAVPASPFRAGVRPLLLPRRRRPSDAGDHERRRSSRRPCER